MPKKINHSARKEIIFEAAMVLFAEQGYHAVTFSNIARKAGISRPTLYGYFKDKEEIFLTALREMTDSMYREYESIAVRKELPSVRKITLICRAILEKSYHKRALLANMTEMVLHLKRNKKNFSRLITLKTIKLKRLFFQIIKEAIHQNELPPQKIHPIIEEIYKLLEAFTFQMALVDNYSLKISNRIIELFLDSLKNHRFLKPS